MEAHEQMDLQEMYSVLENELEDLYSEGVISSAIYNKKSPKRLRLAAINQADRHICLTIKLSKNVSVFIPTGQTVAWFDRQSEYQAAFAAQYSGISDTNQRDIFTADLAFTQVVSVISEFGMAYDQIPLDGATSGIRIKSALPDQVETPAGGKDYQTTGGLVHTISRPDPVFYVNPVDRKMVLSKPFDSDKWVRFEAQIAPLSLKVLTAEKATLDQYTIMSPYFCRDWLIDRAMINLLSRRAASAGGFYDSEAKSARESLQNAPGTGNVIIPGDELDGNYESNFNF